MERARKRREIEKKRERKEGRKQPAAAEAA
jgi:hypothetical protein